MDSKCKRIISLILVLLITFGNSSVVVFGQSKEDMYVEQDPFEMMVDSVPKLMSAEEIIGAACDGSVDVGAIHEARIELKDDEYKDEEVVQQFFSDMEDLIRDQGYSDDVDITLLKNIIKQQQELIEEVKTDRFIVKYKKSGKAFFHNKIQIKDFETQGADASSSELILLDDRVFPSEFAETLRDNGIEKNIEYIQPDFKLGLNMYDGDELQKIQDSIELEVIEELPLNQESDTEFNVKELEIEVEEESDLSALETIESEEPQKVTVAVIDTGMDITHSALKDFIYENEAEIHGNGIDDDGNRYIDDVSGWNFADNSGSVYDEALGLEQAHATHIAGIIAGISNADEDLIPNENVKILPLKVFRNGSAYTSDIISAIHYAEQMGAKIVNCSFGSTDANQALKEAMVNSEMLFVCSVGNARTDLEETPIYPACFDLDNVISVASVNSDGGLSYFSNYSSSLADIAALGRNVRSTLPGGGYGIQNGTSVSAALVSGVAAKAFATSEKLDAVTLKEFLISSADRLLNLQETVVEGRRINTLNVKTETSTTDILFNEPANDFNVRGYSPTQEELYQLYSSSGSVVQVAAGYGFSLVLKNDGSVWAWGRNDYGQCGIGYGSYYEALAQVVGLTEIVSIAAGYNHSLALKSDGTVWAWGNNSNGKLGDGSNSDQYVPVQVTGLCNVANIAAGTNHSLAIQDGTVWAWGDNSSGQLGDGTTTSSNYPVKVSNLEDITGITAGSAHNLALEADGTVWAWGANSGGQLGDGTTTTRKIPVQVNGINSIEEVSSGGSHSMAITSNGAMWSWGSNSSGQLGDGTTATRKIPVQIGTLTNISAIAGGHSFSVALKSDGTVWAWGANNVGQLGDGSTINRTSPVSTVGLTNIVSIVGGYNHSLALKSDGTVWAWGHNFFGQLGIEDAPTLKKPSKINGLTDVVKIDAGSFHSIATDDNGVVWSWGMNVYGQMGNGTVSTNNTQPISANLWNHISDAEVGANHSLAVSDYGQVYSWGYNNMGQLGDGTAISQTEPVEAYLSDEVYLTAGMIVSVSAGGNHSLALCEDGTVWAWGYNYHGQLGDGTTVNRLEMVQVNGLTDVVKISAGENYSLAITRTGELWAWGNNNYGQLGDGTTVNRTTPQCIMGGITDADAGSGHTIALGEFGEVFTWGNNSSGQLGDGTTVNKTSPVLISSINNAISVAAGYSHSLAVERGGIVKAWGQNYCGQLGDGTTFTRKTPVTVSGLTDAVMVNAGIIHSLALQSDGTVFNWGTSIAFDALARTWAQQSIIPVPAQAYTEGFCFESDQYTAYIPSTGSTEIAVSASGYDSYGAAFPTSGISYHLSNTYSGVSINSSTGTITVTSTAKSATIQLIATYGDFTCSSILKLVTKSAAQNIQIQNGSSYVISLNIRDASNLNNSVFTLEYDSSVLEPIDLCKLTHEKETGIGLIEGTGLNITSILDGKIILSFDKAVPNGKIWSGVVNIFQFKALTTGETSITANYE